MLNLSGMRSITDERYYLYNNDGIELRFQARAGVYELERMAEYASLSRTQQKIEITRGEFEAIKKFGRGPIIRESYLLSRDPQITIKLYHGRFEGLIRAEVEFSSLDEARAFQPPPWFGEEMTSLPIANDAKLLDLTDEEFKQLIHLPA